MEGIIAEQNCLGSLRLAYAGRAGAEAGKEEKLNRQGAEDATNYSRKSVLAFSAPWRFNPWFNAFSLALGPTCAP